MDSENEKKQQELSDGQNESSREGYQQSSSQSGNYGGGYQNNGRSQRPRIHSQRAYSTNRTNDNGDEGFRPEGFGAALDSNEGHQYRPRYNQQGGGYRPRYNQQGGGYRPRYNQQGGGYRPRYNNDGDANGDYQQRGGYNNDRQQGDGYSQGGGYQQRGGYNNGRSQGGYSQGGGYQQRGGYNNGRSQGGYSQGGGYQQRGGGYNRGYNNGGYNNGYNNGGYNNGYHRQHSDDYDPNAKYSVKKRIEYKEENIDPDAPIRLNKYLANAGVCSRREADEYIQAGVVSVNGTVVTELGTKVKRSDEVKFHDQGVSLEKKVYVLLNKPKDYVTTSDDPQQRKTVMDLVRNACTERIYPVGRLDRNTTGVLLLTNDGDLASKLTHPKFLKKKIYHVYLDRNVTAHDMEQIAQGVTLEDGEVHADSIAYADEADKSQVGIEIHSGKNRIVRRIFESLDYRVVKLDRVQFAGLTKKNLRRGDWRYLTQQEVEMLRMGAFE